MMSFRAADRAFRKYAEAPTAGRPVARLACGYFEAFAARHLLKMSNHSEQKLEALDDARVSHQTVSWVLKASPSVRDSTRQRVQEAMEPTLVVRQSTRQFAG